MIRNVVHMKEGGIHTGKPKCKRPLVIPKHRWEDNQMEFGETGWGGTDHPCVR
jgi:hypothetical protein